VIPLEFDILYRIAQYGPLTATELRDFNPPHRQFPWQSYATKLGSLRKRGLVTKGTDPASTIWHLTDRGREVVEL
jgi:hypothetical protein